MKRIILLFSLLCFCFFGCTKNETKSDIQKETTIFKEEVKEENLTFAGAWLSYFELSAKGKTKEEYIKYIDAVFLKLKKHSITDAFIHIRPFCDSFYPSELFPFSEHLCGERGKDCGFDVFSIIAEKGKAEGINIHAWINPYRIGEAEKLSENEKAFELYKSGKNDVISVGDSIYLNPASENSQRLILEGIREVMKNYDIKGIHFDDYFYPENISNEDIFLYEKYKSEGGKLSLYDYRRENVNTLISSVYSLVKSFGEDKVFSVSPAGDVEKNRDKLFADVTLWLKGGYCDYVIPQLYFGFRNSSKPFEETLLEWISLSSDNVKLIIGLALYKENEIDLFAGEGKTEWIEDKNVIEKQISLIKEKNLFGYSLYSYSYLK